MSLTIGLDIGTTTITALALDAGRREVMARATLPNDAEITSPADATRGRSEWDAVCIVRRETEVVRAVTGSLGPRRRGLPASV
jgi:sugar (pentulose or hexulose) kinase